MRSIQIRLPYPEGTIERKQRYSSLGFKQNPFPESGVATLVDYNEHQEQVTVDISNWVSERVLGQTALFSPLVLKGSIGVGKTHTLQRILRVVNAYAEDHAPGLVGISRHTLSGVSAKNLALSDFLLEALQSPLSGKHVHPGNDDQLPLVQEILKALHQPQVGSGDDPLDILRERTSPIRPPLAKLLRSSRQTREEAEELFVRWLSRRELSRRELDKLGVSKRLDGEGEAIRAYAHLYLLAKALFGFRCWILMIDQIEDLWTRHEITPVRRARFLTDLRALIDEGLEGAPIAVVLAWNIKPISGSRTENSDAVGKKIADEYRALYARLQNREIDLLMLPTKEHAKAFACAYIQAGVVLRGGEDARDAMISELEEDFDRIFASIPESGESRIGERVVQRALLDALRAWAHESVSETHAKWRIKLKK